MLRALLWINPAVDILVGISGVRMRTYVAASAMVLAPLTVLHVTLVAKGIASAASAPDWFGPVAAFAIVAGLAVWAIRRWRRTAA